MADNRRKQQEQQQAPINLAQALQQILASNVPPEQQISAVKQAILRDSMADDPKQQQQQQAPQDRTPNYQSPPPAGAPIGTVNLPPVSVPNGAPGSAPNPYLSGTGTAGGGMGGGLTTTPNNPYSISYSNDPGPQRTPLGATGSPITAPSVNPYSNTPTVNQNIGRAPLGATNVNTPSTPPLSSGGNPNIAPFPRSNVPGAQLNPYNNDTTGRLFSAGSNMTQMLQDMFPSLAGMYNQSVTPSALAQLAGSQATSGGYNDLMTQLYGQYGPQLANIAGNISGASNMQAANNAVNMINGPGGQLVGQADALQRFLDPEYYTARSQAGDSLGQLLSTANRFNQAGLSPTELSAIQQGLARSNQQAGTQYAPSQTNTVANAMLYGQAGTQRAVLGQNQLANAISAASGFMPQSKSGISGFGTATSQNPTGAANQATSTSLFPGINTNMGQGSTFAGTMAGGLSNNYNQQLLTSENIFANKKDWLDQFDQFTKGLSNIGSALQSGASGASTAMAAGGCWVAREVYGESNPRWMLFREWLTNKAPRWLYKVYNKYGERFAKWIHNKPFIKSMIRNLMERAII